MPLGDGGSLPWVVNRHISNILESAPRVRFGSKADMCSAKRHVRFTPKSDIPCVTLFNLEQIDTPSRISAGHAIAVAPLSEVAGNGAPVG